MKIRAAVLLTLLILAAPDVRAEDARLRSEIIRGIDLIFNADISGGEEAFAAIEDNDPKNPAPYVYRAMALMSYPPREGMGGIDRGIVDGLLTKGISLAEDKEWGEDEGRVKLLVATAYSLLSQLYMEHKDYLKASRAAVSAKRYLDEAVRISPDDPDVKYAVGLVSYGTSELPAYVRPLLSLLSVSGDRESGLRFLEEAAADGVYSKTSARMALLMILVNMEHDYRRAIVYGEDLISRYPDNPEIYFPYAYALSETGNGDAALAVAAALKGKIDARLPYFDGAIVPRYHHLVGKILMDQRRLPEAADELRRALVVTDENYAWVRPLALARLGMIEDISGRRDNAIGRYREAIDTGIEGTGREMAEKYLKEPYRGGLE